MGLCWVFCCLGLFGDYLVVIWGRLGAIACDLHQRGHVSAAKLQRRWKPTKRASTSVIISSHARYTRQRHGHLGCTLTHIDERRMSRVAANRTLGASAVRCGAATLAGAEDPPQGADNLKFELSALRGPHIPGGQSLGTPPAATPPAASPRSNSMAISALERPATWATTLPWLGS